MQYATRFCDPALGFSLGYTYWFKCIVPLALQCGSFSNLSADIIVTPNQLTAAALVIQYWVDRETINPGVFIAIFLVAIIAINYLGIKFFGGMSCFPQIFATGTPQLTFPRIRVLALFHQGSDYSRPSDIVIYSDARGWP